MKIERIKLLEEKVRYVLEHFPKTRDDDTYCTLKIIAVYLPDEVIKQDGKYFFSSQSLERVREDAVKRIRARLQNEKGLFLPTDPEIRYQRRISEEQWVKYLGLNPEMMSIPTPYYATK